MRSGDGARGPADALAILLVAAAGVRLLGSVVGGFVAWSMSGDDFAPASEHAGAVLNTFGAAGDTAGALVLVAAVAAIGWGRINDRGLRAAVRALLAVTAILVCLRLASVYVIGSSFSSGASVQDAVITGFAFGDLLLCAGAWEALRRFGAASVVAGDDFEPLLFAVDRGNAEVFAFFGFDEAARTIGVYSIEGNEFTFYADDGALVNAAVVDDRADFTVTDDDRRDELLAHLRRFAGAHQLDVDDRSDPTAYAVPISDWQWLQLWPGWMRPLGRLVGRLRR